MGILINWLPPTGRQFAWRITTTRVHFLRLAAMLLPAPVQIPQKTAQRSPGFKDVKISRSSQLKIDLEDKCNWQLKTQRLYFDHKDPSP